MQSDPPLAKASMMAQASAVSTRSVSLGEIAEGMENDEFVFHYQPKVSMLTGSVCGAEALIRWQKPDGSMIQPAAFIPLAEETDFITEITDHMYPKLVEDIRLLLDVDPEIMISFNASAKDFESPRLIEAIAASIKENRIPAGALEVELTEASLLASQSDVGRHLQDVRDLGVSLAMDDFGEGYSSMDTLGRCPFSTIKLDQHIIRRAQTSPKDVAILESSIRMAHKIGLHIVAEGIEDWRTYHQLLNAGCTLAQGFWVSRGLPLLEFMEFLKAGRCWPAPPVGLLHMAELDHVEWRKSIIDAVFYARAKEGETPSRLPWPEFDHTLCGLGRWYYGTGRHFVDSPWYRQLEAPHCQVHETGLKVKRAVRDEVGDQELLSLLRQISAQSAEIVRILQEIQHDALAEMGADGSEYVGARLEGKKGCRGLARKPGG